MKKLIFLLLTAVILTGFVSATEIAYPPWDISLDAALSELGVDGPAVTSDTVLVDVSLYADQLAAGNISFDYKMTQVCGTGQANELNGVAGVLPDYPLLL